MNAVKEFLWVELYRPRTVAECILPSRIKSVFQSFVDKKEIPNLLLFGKPGSGKTTVAKALCEEIGCEYMFINGSDESGIETFRGKVKRFASTISFSPGRKVIIFDEADYMNPQSLQPSLRSAMEEFSENCTFIFTCNKKNRIIDALQSRCNAIDFTLQPAEKPKMAGMFFGRIQSILKSENIEYDQAVVAKLISKYFPDFRKVLNTLQPYSLSGKIDSGVLANYVETDNGDCIKAMKEKDFAALRKWIAINSNTDPGTLFSGLYETLYKEIAAKHIPDMIVTLADYQYKSAFVSDQELNLAACLSTIMVNMEFK